MNVTQPFQVGIISDSGMEVQRRQGLELIRMLGRVRGKFGRPVTLHHCGTSQADNIARTFAVNAGWQVETHPTYKGAGMIPWRTAVRHSSPEIIHPARTPRERDMEVIRKSHLIVAVEFDFGMGTGLLRKAEAEGRAVVHIKHAHLNALSAPIYSGVIHDWLVDEWR